LQLFGEKRNKVSSTHHIGKPVGSGQRSRIPEDSRVLLPAPIYCLVTPSGEGKDREPLIYVLSLPMVREGQGALALGRNTLLKH